MNKEEHEEKDITKAAAHSCSSSMSTRCNDMLIEIPSNHKQTTLFINVVKTLHIQKGALCSFYNYEHINTILILKFRKSGTMPYL